MKIVFVHRNRAFLPELTAYQDFFSNRNIITSHVMYNRSIPDADVYWYMMGCFPGGFHKDKILIHEYASASVPPYRKIKDLLKARMNPRPHFRLFLNEYVKEQINIHDEIPFGFRDMGISPDFINNALSEKKEYDFIYIGNLSRIRNLENLLSVFEKGALANKTLLLLGNDESGLADRFKPNRNILFHTGVPWKEVPSFLSRAKYAINFIPDREPYSAQTSTKFLEYASMKMPIITSNNFWISEFQERYGGDYFFIKEDLSNMTWDRISTYPFEPPDLSGWSWEERIKESGVWEFLKQTGIPI